MSSERPLTIGIDARAAFEVAAGRGRVVRELLLALAAREDPHSYRCYARTRWQEPLDARFQWREIGARDPLWHVRTARAAERECDVFLSNSYLTVCLTRTASVTLVYDLTTFDRALRSNRRPRCAPKKSARACSKRRRVPSRRCRELGLCC